MFPFCHLPQPQTQWNQNGNWVLTASRDQTCKVRTCASAACKLSVFHAFLASLLGHARLCSPANFMACLYLIEVPCLLAYSYTMCACSAS